MVESVFSLKLENNVVRLLIHSYNKEDQPIKCQCCPHIETSELICCANQFTGFYIRATLALNGLNQIIYLFRGCFDIAVEVFS